MDSLNRHEDYGQEALDETHLLSDPFAQFKQWLVDAEQADIYEPNAFVLGTATTDGQPRSRTVLLKGVDSQGFFLATNFESRKGRAIAANSKVSATFGWYSMYRQVLVPMSTLHPVHTILRLLRGPVISRNQLKIEAP
jgi:pyridoxamine 5'-phosphate oxidase